MLSEVSNEAASSPPRHELELLAEGPPGPRARLLEGLTEPQREAVSHPGPWLVVDGVAGSGKTRVIEARFQWLVAGGLASERIVVLVPTPARAVAIRAQLEAALSDGYERLWVLAPRRAGPGRAARRRVAGCGAGRR